MKFPICSGKSFVFAGAFVALILALCAGTASADPGTTPDSPANSSPITGSPSLTPPAASVGSKVTTTQANYALGSDVRMIYTITNNSKSPVNYIFPSEQQSDFTVTDSTGKEVWRWSYGRVFNQKVQHLTLGAGKSVTYTADWRQRDNGERPVPAGTYTIQAQFLPMERSVVTGGLIVDPDPDPINLGVPKDKVESGAVKQTNLTPSLSAKTSVTIAGNS